MDALVGFGTIFIGTRDFTLASLLTLLYSLWIKPSLSPLTLHATFLSQSPDCSLTPADIDAFLERQFRDGASEWTCISCVRFNRYQGPAREAFKVRLQHKTMQHESPMREMPIRVLSATLLGTHTISGQSIRILPSYAREVPGDVDKVFGGSLILMHLKSFHEGVTTSRNNDAEWSGIDWMRHVLLALKTFTDGFETVSEFLTNEQILELSGVLGNPKLEMIAKILLAILNACKDKSDKDIKLYTEKFKNIDMREKVELVQHTFKPVLTFGRVLSVIIEGIGDTYIPDSEMEQLSRALLGVKGCMVPFRGAVGTILEQLKDEEKTGEIITIASWACIFLTSVAPPLGFLAIGSFIYHSEKACGKSRERGMLSALEAANTRIDMMTACTRLYVVLVVMKAGNFFDKGSRQYDEYRLLMREIFELDIDEEANVSRYIKTTGQQICCHVKYVQGKVKMYTESYGVQPIEDNTDW